MRKASKLAIATTLTFVIGFLMLLLGILFLIGSNYITGLLLILGSSLLLTYRKEFIIIDPGVIVSRKIWLIALSSKTINIGYSKGTIQSIDSTHELFGINKRPSTFFTYDIVYVKPNHHKVHVFTSTGKSQANKVAKFLSANLAITIESKSILRKK